MIDLAPIVDFIHNWFAETWRYWIVGIVLGIWVSLGFLVLFLHNRLKKAHPIITYDRDGNILDDTTDRVDRGRFRPRSFDKDQ